MNRVVDAVGLEGTEEEHRESGRRLASIGYDATMAKALDASTAVETMGLEPTTPTLQR